MSEPKFCPLKVASGASKCECSNSCAWNISTTIGHPECALVNIAKNIKKATY